MIKPNFFIVGAPKCGTTAMNDYLSQHPDIFMARKEIHYFGKDLKIRQTITEQEYLESFRQANNKKIIGEASVWYLYSQKAAEEIKSFSPDAKILIMLRNPVDMVYSLHSQNLYDGNEDIFDFEKAINFDEERMKGNQLPYSADFTQLPAYKNSALYYEQVKRYLEIFDHKNVKVILYDEFVEKTEKVVKETLSFLGLNTLLDIEYIVVNPNKHVKLSFIHSIIKSPSQRLKRIAQVIIPFKRIRHLLMGQLLNLNVNNKKRKKISNELRDSLQKYFSNDIILLEKLINRDLSKWLS
jgi:hypothetical protein